jgi:hypothetical protein
MPSNAEVVVGDVVSFAAGVGTDSSGPPKVLRITDAVNQRVPDEADTDVGRIALSTHRDVLLWAAAKN